MLNEKDRPGFGECTGCRVCTLPCPVWRQTNDMSLTLFGRARALQAGATPEDLRQSIMACVLCGACEPTCPVGIDTVGMTIHLRSMLADMKALPLPPNLSPDNHSVPIQEPLSPGKGDSVFLPGQAFQKNRSILKKTRLLLEKNNTLSVMENMGPDIGIILEAGLQPDRKYKDTILRSLKDAKELIITEGILYRYLRAWLPRSKVIHLGEALLRIEEIRNNLKSTDLYVIDTRAFHADHSRLVGVYDRLRQEVGCVMNMDLQRIAIPTGVRGLRIGYNRGMVSPSEQARWILDGYRMDRIVIEDLEDMEVFRHSTKHKVIHISELAVDK
ncbi:4Fe-4S dicluster domain-containing protein [Thermodesulfobacteriota bacterium]